jgi:D-amino-acid dehydrogenase
MSEYGPVSASTAVVVVGGGIVAASIAYHLARQGVSVVVAAGQQAGAATDAGAGIICPWRREREGDPAYQLAVAGARYYPELIDMLADDGETDTGYARVGALCVADDAEQLAVAAARLRALLPTTPEIGQITELGAPEPCQMFPALASNLGGLWISGGARIDGRAIRDSLFRAAARHGARLIPENAVLRESGSRVTGVLIGGDAIDAGAVVVAVGAWTAQVCPGQPWQLPIGPQRGQIVHVQLDDADTASWPVILPAGDPYLLAFPGGRVVFGATRESAGFEYRTTVSGVSWLLASALRLAPGLGAASLLETRIGFRPATSDGRPLLGWLADGLIVAAGNGAEGLTAGVWTGSLAAMLALDEQPGADLSPFDPTRFGRAPHEDA